MRCTTCEARAEQLADTPLGRAMAQWADVVLTVTECDHGADDDGEVMAPARFVPPNSLVVDECPLCQRRHVHGAGQPAPGSLPHPDMYGPRSPHCHRKTGGSYRLVPAEGQQ